MRALVAAGVKGVPSTKYLAIDATLCDASNSQFGTEYKFKKRECILRNCQHCGKVRFKIHLDELNTELLSLNNVVTWHKWEKIEGCSAPQKCMKKKPL